jgi:large subunit ribosomal protein L31
VPFITPGIASNLNKTMKQKIHPKYYPGAKARCACGKVFIVGSTREKIEIEICSNCHPFYTGKEKLIDTAGKVEKFKARRKKAETTPKKLKKTEKRAQKAKAKKEKKAVAQKKKSAVKSKIKK